MSAPRSPAQLWPVSVTLALILGLAAGCGDGEKESLPALAGTYRLEDARFHEQIRAWRCTVLEPRLDKMLSSDGSVSELSNRAEQWLDWFWPSVQERWFTCVLEIEDKRQDGLGFAFDLRWGTLGLHLHHMIGPHSWRYGRIKRLDEASADGRIRLQLDCSSMGTKPPPPLEAEWVDGTLVILDPLQSEGEFDPHDGSGLKEEGWPEWAFKPDRLPLWRRLESEESHGDQSAEPSSAAACPDWRSMPPPQSEAPAAGQPIVLTDRLMLQVVRIQRLMASVERSAADPQAVLDHRGWTQETWKRVNAEIERSWKLRGDWSRMTAERLTVRDRIRRIVDTLEALERMKQESEYLKRKQQEELATKRKRLGEIEAKLAIMEREVTERRADLERIYRWLPAVHAARVGH